MFRWKLTEENYSEGISKFQIWIEQLSLELNHMLVQEIMKNFRLLDHLKCLKLYMLLGRGDFIANLMDKLTYCFF